MYKVFAFLSSLVLVVNAQYAVQAVGGKDHIRGVVGQNYSLQCEQMLRKDSTEPAPDLTWSREQVTLEDGPKYGITEVKNETDKYTLSTLVIKNAQLSDNGEYRCDGNSGGAAFSLSLSVDAEVSIKSSEGDGFLLAEGLVLVCGVGEGVNVTRMMWYYKKDTQEETEWMAISEGEHDLNRDGSKEVTVSGDTVTVLTADHAAAGVYNCSVKVSSVKVSEGPQPPPQSDAVVVSNNTVFTSDHASTGVYNCLRTIEDRTQFDVVVVLSMLEVHAPQSIKVSESEKGVIRCTAASYPHPEIVWAVNDTVIEESSEKYTIEQIDLGGENENISQLHILDVTIADGESTTYTCTGRIGDVEVEEQIIVRIRDPLAALWPFIGIVSEVAILIVIILIHEACTKEDIGETDDDEEDTLLQKDRTITRDGEQTRMRGTNN